MNKIRIHINARRWFDRKYGNTYHSVAVYFPDGTVKTRSFVYGYGNQWEYTAFELIVGKDKTRYENGSPMAPWRWYEEHNYLVTSECVDVTRKKDLHQEGD